MSFERQVAVVTGAGSGIGAALTRALTERGAKVVATDIDVAGLARVAQDTGCEQAELDVSRGDRFEALLRDVHQRYGRIDLLFNNAGIGVGGELLDLSVEDWRRVLDVNLWGVLHGARAAYALMRQQGFGQIVNVASIAGLVPYSLALPYTTTKHAVVGFSQALRAEAADYGVSVSVVCPGAIETPIWTRSPLRGDDDRERALEWVKRAWMPVDQCAAKILAGVAKKKAVIPVTREAWVLWLLHRLSPTLSLRVHRMLVGKLRAQPVRRVASTAAV